MGNLTKVEIYLLISKGRELCSLVLGCIPINLSNRMSNISGNFLVMQDYIQDTELQYAKEWFDGPLDIVHIQMPYMEEKIALNWQ